MKKTMYKLSVVLLLVMTVVGCETEELVYDVENGQTLAQFSESAETLGIPETGATAEVEVLVSTVSSEERVVDVTIDESSTATADQYTISDLVIPANSYVGTVSIAVDFAALPESGSVSLVLNLEGIEGGDSVVEKGTYEVEFFRKCPVVKDQLVGTWVGTDSWGYATEVQIAYNDAGELTINGLLFGWMTDYWGEVIVTNDPVVMDVNVEDETITIEEQFYMTTTWNGDPQPYYNLKGTGVVLNACENKIEISTVLNQPGLAGILDGGFNVVLEKQ